MTEEHLFDEGGPDVALETAERYEACRRALGTLPAREELTLRHRFGFTGVSADDRTDVSRIRAEIGAKLGVGLQRVLQIEQRALWRLRRPNRTKFLWPHWELNSKAGSQK